MSQFLIRAKSRDVKLDWIQGDNFLNIIKKIEVLFVSSFQFSSQTRSCVQMESKTKGQHRKVECDICKKFTRFCRLKGHKRTHKDSLLVSGSEIKDELENRQEIRKKQEEEKIQKVVEIARENGSALPEEIVSKKRKSAEEIP